MVRQAVVPFRLLRRGEMRVGRTGTGHDEHLRLAQQQRLRSQYKGALGRSEDGGEGAVAHHALEAGDAGLVALEFGDQRRGARGKFVTVEFGGFRGGTLHYVGEADAVRGEKAIMVRFEAFDAKRMADRLAECGT